MQARVPLRLLDLIASCMGFQFGTPSPSHHDSSVVFDSVILFLTVIKLRRDEAKDSVVGNRILRDNVFYFVVVSVTNTVVLVINCLGPGFDSVKPATLPYPTVMNIAMGTRWVFPKNSDSCCGLIDSA